MGEIINLKVSMVNFDKIKSVITSLKLWQIISLAFVLRVCWYLFILITNPQGFWQYDSYGYWNIAYNVHEYGVFSRDEIAPLLPDYFRTPLYPLMILPTLIYDFNGYSIPLIQIVIDCISCWIIFKTIQLFTNEIKYAKWGALIFAINIPSIIMCSFVLTETLFAFLIVFFIYRLFFLVQHFSLKNALITGLIGGFAVMCKPLGFILIMPAVLLILFLKSYKLNTLFTILILSITFYAVQFPWMQRNKNVFGRYFNSVLGEHLLLGYHASNVYAKANNISFNQAQEILRDAFFDKINYDPYKHPYEYAKLIENESYKIFLSHKTIFLKEHLKECFKFFVQPMRGYINAQMGNHGYTFGITTGLIVLQVMQLFIIYGSMLIALILFIRKKIKFNWVMVFLFFTVLLFSQFNTMPYTDARIRVPIDPLLIILSTFCFMLIRRKHIQ